MRLDMSDQHKDQLLRALMYYLPMDVRGKVIRDVPAAYNAFHGREIVKVVRVEDETAI